MAGKNDASGSCVTLRRVGRFEVRRFLGEGAYGRVYEGYDPQLDRAIALKVAKLDQMDSTDRVKRFLREARAAANLRHPHIVPVFDAGREGDCFYIASAIIAGQSLCEVLQLARPGPRRGAQIVRRLAEALAYAHSKGVVHRDVKPANVLLDEAGDPVLTDFGVAFRREEERLTREGALVGTPQYMSPEQARGQTGPALPASDQYSLGVVFYELLAGRPPFAGTLEVTLFHHLKTEPEPPSRINPEIPRELEAICLRCLHKDPAQRFADCSAMAEALGQWLDGKQPDSALRDERKPRRKKVKVLSVASPPPAQQPTPVSGFRLHVEGGFWQLALITLLVVAGWALVSFLGK
jgi:serine/threonine protein kinase